MEQTLYVSRPVINAEALFDWFRINQAMPKVVPPEQMHVTLVYSKKAVEWEKLGKPEKDRILIVSGIRKMKILGQPGTKAITMQIHSPSLNSRWKYFIDRGCSTDYDKYQPHITISYHPSKETIIEELVPWRGTITLGPEKWVELNTNWRDSVVEK